MTDSKASETRKAPSPFGCIAAGVAFTLALFFLPWDEAFKIVVHLLAFAAQPLACIAAGAVVTGVCMLAKGALPPGARGPNVIAGLVFGPIALLVALLFGAIALDLGRLGKLEYQDVMSTRPEAWEPGAHSSRFSSHLVQDGYRSLWVRQSKCLDLLGWGVPSPYYDFTINDRPATPAACRRGLNVLEWSARTPPAG